MSTYKDKAGIERWSECNTKVSQDNAFRQAWGGARINVAEMANSARSALATSMAVSRAQGNGINRGKIPGISMAADDRLNMVPKQFDIYTRAGSAKK